jgi:hypothetical protein
MGILNTRDTKIKILVSSEYKSDGNLKRVVEVFVGDEVAKRIYLLDDSGCSVEFEVFGDQGLIFSAFRNAETTFL